MTTIAELLGSSSLPTVTLEDVIGDVVDRLEEILDDDEDPRAAVCSVLSSTYDDVDNEYDFEPLVWEDVVRSIALLEGVGRVLDCPTEKLARALWECRDAA